MGLLDSKFMALSKLLAENAKGDTKACRADSTSSLIGALLLTYPLAPAFAAANK